MCFEYWRVADRKHKNADYKEVLSFLKAPLRAEGRRIVWCCTGIKSRGTRDRRLKYEPCENIISKLLNLRTTADGIRVDALLSLRWSWLCNYHLSLSSAHAHHFQNSSRVIIVIVTSRREPSAVSWIIAQSIHVEAMTDRTSHCYC